MTFSSRVGNPLGLAQASQRAQARKAGALSIVAHNGAAVWGGAEINLVHLLTGLQQSGHEVTLCCNHDLVADRAARHLIPTVVKPLRGDLMLGDAVSFARFLRQQQPDVLVLGTFKKIWLGGLAAQRAKVPLTITRVSLASDTPRRWKYRYALEHWINIVTLNAESMRARFLADGPRVDPAKVVTLHDGVEQPRLRAGAAALRAQLRIPAQAKVIGTIARLSRQKRLERLLAVTADLPGVHCIIAGEGSELARLKTEVQRLNLSDRVHLLGFRDDIGDVLNALDVFLITSDQEGMSNAMLEALWLGVPVVSTPVSGAHEALAPDAAGAPGRVTKSFEVAELTAAVRELLNDARLREQASERARARAQERFSFERMVLDFETLMRAGPAALRAAS